MNDFNIEQDVQLVLQEELVALRESIAANIREKGLNTSGATIASMQVQVDGIQGTLYGRPYFATLETGSRPWARQYAKPPRFFVQIIRDWASMKGLDINAWLTARKIMREGSKIFREGGRKDIFTREIDTTLDNIGTRLAGLFVVAATQRL